MFRTAVAAALGTAMLSPAASMAQPAGQYQVIRPGDRQMSCETLINEINALQTEQFAKQARANQLMTEMTRSSMAMARPSMGGGGMGMASGAMSMGMGLASMVPGVGIAASLAGSAASQAMAAGAQAKAQADMNKAMEEMQANAEAMAAAQMEAMGPSPQNARLEHLNKLYSEKTC